jgi:hypothetical protein
MPLKQLKPLLAHILLGSVFQSLSFIFNRDDLFSKGKAPLELQIVNNSFFQD